MNLRYPSLALRLLGVLTLPWVIAGCSVALLPETQPQRIFTLPYGYQPETGERAAEGAFPALKVVQPRASGVLAGKRIVIESEPNELAVYSEVSWMTEAPVLVQNHLVRALREDSRLDTVVSDAGGASSDVTFTSNLLAFQESRSGGTATVRIYLQAQLVENGSRRILATRDFKIQSPIQGNGVESVVEAFGSACDQLASELAEWMVNELDPH